jgi:hypothetical protein
MQNLILATDNRSFVNLGNLHILFSLSEVISENKLKIYLIYPQNAPISSIYNSYSIFKNNISFVPTPISEDDPYYIQLGICKVFEILSNKEDALYIDYDHLILDNNFTNYFVEKNVIIVSSEIKEIPPVNQNIELNYHYNTSLIYGKGEELKKVGTYWTRVYSEIKSNTSYRNRTEIAFTLAAKAAKVKLIPCNENIQSNFSKRAMNFQLFHFGGDSMKSKIMKLFLQNYSNNFNPSQFDLNSYIEIKENLEKIIDIKI